jgi:AcrR family transcriptional regulator
MRSAKVSDRQLFSRLARVFCKKGYDGTSYADVMKATGLVKASLYYRFPGGKEQMVNALLSEVDRQFSEYVLRPALEWGSPAQRALKIARRLSDFYHSGEQWCLLDTLTLAESPATIAHARKSMEFWVESFARLARESGVPGSTARKPAEDAVASIEGALVVSRVLRNRRPFQHALAGLPKHLTGKS